jgi:hypothetical protein
MEPKLNSYNKHSSNRRLSRSGSRGSRREDQSKEKSGQKSFKMSENSRKLIQGYVSDYNQDEISRKRWE